MQDYPMHVMLINLPVATYKEDHYYNQKDAVHKHMYIDRQIQPTIDSNKFVPIKLVMAIIMIPMELFDIS